MVGRALAAGSLSAAQLVEIITADRIMVAALIVLLNIDCAKLPRMKISLIIR
jgi:hypothetical protein